jgi:hypothetical protein
MTWHAAHAADVVDADLLAYRCGKAGPGGWGACTTWCATYCDLAMENCTSTAKLFDSKEECEAACAQIPVDADAIAVGFPSDPGDSVQCRLGFLLAAKLTPGLSCPEAIPADLAPPGASKVCAAN